MALLADGSVPALPSGESQQAAGFSSTGLISLLVNTALHQIETQHSLTHSHKLCQFENRVYSMEVIYRSSDSNFTLWMKDFINQTIVEGQTKTVWGVLLCFCRVWMKCVLWWMNKVKERNLNSDHAAEFFFCMEDFAIDIVSLLCSVIFRNTVVLDISGTQYIDVIYITSIMLITLVNFWMSLTKILAISYTVYCPFYRLQGLYSWYGSSHIETPDLKVQCAIYCVISSIQW